MNIKPIEQNEVKQIVFNHDGGEMIKMSKGIFWYKGEKIEDINNVYEKFSEWVGLVNKKEAIDYSKIEQEFQDWVDAGLWEGEDKYTKNFAVGNVTQWWINKIKEII